MERCICIHGHFYQPPRENPWLESIETQDSAAPYHDWNERIDAECYSANAASRILDGQDRILRIVNNYARMSFNFGPSLLSWMEKEDPDTYQAILLADRESQERFSGHGSAMAQVYNHMILPLANAADKRTQVRWGRRDFERRFGRAPEGMWLAETAADTETLSALAEEGIRFTVLSPFQARRFRPLGAKAWLEAEGGRIDPSRAYRFILPSGKSIDLFFYDGNIARAVAFEGLLRRGEYLVDRLMSAFSADRRGGQLSHVATDGESYGHHHRFGDMALAYAFSLLEKRADVRLTNYGEFLEKYPPHEEVEIAEGSSWSCCHGVERWRGDCGCNATATAGWNQSWRAPLRDALDWLRDALTPRFQKIGKRYFKDPWEARDRYLSVIADRSPENRERFLAENATAAGKRRVEDRIAALKLMELQRNAMLMYTSCGWFFDELSGIETVQILRYAGRVIHLAEEVLDCRIEERFLEKLREARSNLPERGTGADIYRKEVAQARIRLEDVVAHYAISSLFESYTRREEVHCYQVENLERQEYRLGKPQLTVGQLLVASRVTGEQATLAWGALHFGDHNILCGVRRLTSTEEYAQLRQTWQTPAEQADLTQIIRLLEHHFPGAVYSLRSLFQDQRRRLIDMILRSTLEEAADLHRKIYRENAPLMRLLSELSIPLPAGLRAAAEFALTSHLQECLTEDSGDPAPFLSVAQEAEGVGVRPDYTFFARRVEEKILQSILRAEKEPEAVDALIAARRWAAAGARLPVKAQPAKAQLVCLRMLSVLWSEYSRRASAGDEPALRWKSEFQQTAEQLGFSPALF